MLASKLRLLSKLPVHAGRAFSTPSAAATAGGSITLDLGDVFTTHSKLTLIPAFPIVSERPE